MDVHWQRKKERSGGMSNPQINEWYDAAMANGALGGKLIGAGGGGFLMFYAQRQGEAAPRDARERAARGAFPLRFRGHQDRGLTPAHHGRGSAGTRAGPAYGRKTRRLHGGLPAGNATAGDGCLKLEIPLMLSSSSLADWPVAILAGGLATRLRPITETIPKTLVPVAGEPFLAHQLRLLHSHGLRRAVLCVGHLGERIEAEFGDGSAYGFRLQYSFDGPKLLGTGGAIKRALPLLGERFIILYGDSYLPMDYAGSVAAFEASGQPGLMTVFHNEGRWDTSNVVFADGTIRTYDKKERQPAMQHIDYGLGILKAETLAPYPTTRRSTSPMSTATFPAPGIWPGTKCDTAFTRLARTSGWPS